VIFHSLFDQKAMARAEALYPFKRTSITVEGYLHFEPRRHSANAAYNCASRRHLARNRISRFVGREEHAALELPADQ